LFTTIGTGTEVLTDEDSMKIETTVKENKIY